MHRSGCPINLTLETLGDRWSLIVVRDLMFGNRRHFRELLTRSEEGRAFRYVPQFSREELHQEAAGHAFRQLLDASPASSLPLSFLVEILSERDAQLLDDLRKVVERKRRELGQRELAQRELGQKEKE